MPDHADDVAGRLDESAADAAGARSWLFLRMRRGEGLTAGRGDSWVVWTEHGSDGRYRTGGTGELCSEDDPNC